MHGKFRIFRFKETKAFLPELKNLNQNVVMSMEDFKNEKMSTVESKSGRFYCVLIVLIY
jgi:hypothetical protein